jgi:uncharacterized protein (TIGR03435 family)
VFLGHIDLIDLNDGSVSSGPLSVQRTYVSGVDFATRGGRPVGLTVIVNTGDKIITPGDCSPDEIHTQPVLVPFKWTGTAYQRVRRTEQATSRGEFEAASIKISGPSKTGGEGGNRSRIEYSPDSVTARNASLKECIQWAYGVEIFQISGPEPQESYDIRGKSETPVPVGVLRVMFQDLLLKRFNLRFHRETKMMPVYALIVAKRGAKLPPQKAEADIVHARENLPRVEAGAFVPRDATLSDFAAMLHQLRGVEFPVQDRTGIQGVFDISLKGAPEAARQGDTGLLFSLIEEQLGLKLIATKGPVEMLVIERAEKPSSN